MALNLDDDILDMNDSDEEENQSEKSDGENPVVDSWLDIENHEEIEKQKKAKKEEEERLRKEAEEQARKEAKEKAKREAEEKSKREAEEKAKKETEEKQKKGKSIPAPAPETSIEEDRLRSPICVIMGHVDTGKTKLLDKIRKTNVQLGEAGGITQQIGATYFPSDTLKKMTRFFAEKYKLEYMLPGLLIIDTPGHQSFTNLRSRGSSLCDIAILVVDIMHGIQSQTLESISLLQAKRTPFIIALNKIDCIADWAPSQQQYCPFAKTYPTQSQACKDHFQKRLSKVTTEFAEKGINVTPYFKLKYGENVKITEIPIVPTSARTGEGIPDLLMLVQLITQTKMKKKLVSKNELQCSVLEVKVEEGIGTTLDVVLVNGVLKVHDTIVLAGQKDGVSVPIVTTIRALLTPQPLKELRVKSEWVSHPVIYAAMGCKISASNLDGAIAGSELFVAHDDNEVELYQDKVLQDTQSILQQVDKEDIGLMVQSSTLGSLEALLSYLHSKNLKVAQIAIGPVHRKDVLAIAPMVEKAPTYAVILAFDVTVTPEAKAAAQEFGVTIFEAKIIYHLTDQYEQFLATVKARAKEAARKKAVFPAIIKINNGGIFRRNDPMILGVTVLEGTLRKGTPLCALVNDKIRGIGTIDGLKLNDKDVEKAPTGSEVSVSIKAPGDWTPVAGKDVKDEMYSRINREIIDILKEHFRDEMTKDDWQTVIKLKKILHISNA